MHKYHYDQVYSYEKILQEVKELIMPAIIEMVHPDDITNTGLSANILTTGVGYTRPWGDENRMIDASR